MKNANVSIKFKDEALIITCINPKVLNKNSLKNYIRKYIKKQLLREKAYSILAPKVEYYAKKYNFQYKKVRMMENKQTRGTCSGDNTISLHVSLITMSENYQKYVILHELTHTIYMNHKKEFWDHLKSIFPEYEAARKEAPTLIIYGN